MSIKLSKQKMRSTKNITVGRLIFIYFWDIFENLLINIESYKDIFSITDEKRDGYQTGHAFSR